MKDSQPCFVPSRSETQPLGSKGIRLTMWLRNKRRLSRQGKPSHFCGWAGTGFPGGALVLEGGDSKRVFSQ